MQAHRTSTHTTPAPTPPTPTGTHARESLGRAGVLSSPGTGRPAIPPQSPPSRASFGCRVSSRPSRRHAGACRPTEPVERSLVRQTSRNPLLCCDEKEDRFRLGGWLQVGRTPRGHSSSSVARNLQNLAISLAEGNMLRGFRVLFALDSCMGKLIMISTNNKGVSFQLESTYPLLPQQFCDVDQATGEGENLHVKLTDFVPGTKRRPLAKGCFAR